MGNELSGQIQKSSVRPTDHECFRSKWIRSRVLIPSTHVGHAAYLLTLILCGISGLLVLYLIIELSRSSYFPSNVSYDEESLIPAVQFDRGDVSRQEVLQNAQKALEKVTAFQELGYNLGEGITATRDIFYHLVKTTQDRKLKKQIIALQSFDVYGKEYFEKLTVSGYDLKLKGDQGAVYDYVTFDGKSIDARKPDYDTLCHKYSKTYKIMDREMSKQFCDKLKDFGSNIEQGKELPLLTLFTWWVDPISDPDVKGKRSVMTNWDLFRPFVIPVVLTNARMNMALANTYGWPVLPVRRQNQDGLPVFKDAAKDMTSEFNSTFYGYAMANSYFDVSLLETLMAIKDQFESPDEKDFHVKNRKEQQTGAIISRATKIPIQIHGRALRLSADPGSENCEKFEYLHQHIASYALRNINRRTRLTNQESFFIFRGVDFKDYDTAVVDNEYLIPYLVHFGLERGVISLNVSRTIFSAKTTPNHDVFNEWGRHYISLKLEDPGYNRGLVDELMKQISTVNSSLMSGGRYSTVLDDKNSIRIVSLD